ncbi:hypothetical protein ACOMHN_065361 [Nucella lapillus]
MALCKRMRQDLDVVVAEKEEEEEEEEEDDPTRATAEGQECLSRLTRDWLLNRQKVGVITKPLDYEMKCYIEISKLWLELREAGAAAAAAFGRTTTRLTTLGPACIRRKKAVGPVAAAASSSGSNTWD